MRASELAEWVQKHVDLGEGVSPNHGWRHSFSTNAEAAGVPKRISTALTGHNKKKDASDGYVTPSLGQLREAMDRFPRYRI
jgi:integrase